MYAHMLLYLYSQMALILKNHSNLEIPLLRSVNVRLCDCRGPLTKESPTEKALRLLFMLAQCWGIEEMTNSFDSPFTILSIC